MERLLNQTEVFPKKGETSRFKIPWICFSNRTIEMHYKDVTFRYRVNQWGKIEYVGKESQRRLSRYINDHEYRIIREEVDEVARVLFPEKFGDRKYVSPSAPSRKLKPEQFELGF